MNTVYAIRRAGSARMTPMASALALTLFSGLAVSVTPPMMDGPGALPTSAAASLLMDSPASTGTALYTIVFKEAPVATYSGETAGYARPQRVLQGASTGKLDIQASTTVAYANYLQNRQDVFIADIGAGFGRSIEVRARMQHALNAVIVELTSAEAAAVNQRPDVDFVEREHQLELNTDNSGTFIGAPSIYDGFTASGAASKGEGIVIGDIDTGINWQSPAFAAVGPIDGYVHVNPRGAGNYLGLCQAGQTDAGRCNDKLIGMYNFASTLSTRSGEDTQGHGSHTASTAAGNRWLSIFSGGPFTVSGIAPHANVIAYLACPSTCPSTATSQSANQAVIDGVDVINYSISGGTSPWTDTTSTAFRNANAAGVFVAASAGNTSTTVTNPVGQVNHLEPWVETVAASTQNRLIGVGFTLDGGPANTQDVAMRTGAPPLPTANINGAPLIKSPNFANGSTDGCAPYPTNFFTRPFSQPAEYIFADGFDGLPAPTTVGGIAVLRLDASNSSCASGARRTAALAAGAVGVIYVDTNYINLGASATSWSMLLSDWTNIEAAYTPATATTSINITAKSYPAVGDRVADFSFRGPRLVSGQGIIKPDITAPGVDILAVGAANVVGPNGVYLNNGTSMSSPHMAGSAALLRGINPSWTPPQIKSALNLSSNNFGAINQDGSPVTVWDYGSGRVNLTATAKVGLIMDETPANFLAANPATGGDVSTLNLANISKFNIIGTQVFTRTFRRARAGSQTYSLAVTGLPPAAVSVSPASFFINSSGSATVTVTVNSALLTEAQWTLGELLLTPAGGDEPNLHLPIAVYPGGPQITVSPASLSGSSDTTVSNNLTITNTANPTLNWMFQTTGTAVVTPFNAPTTTNGQNAARYAGPPVRGYYWSQNFDIAATTHVTTLRANGFTLPSTTSLTTANTPLVTFSIYANNAGNPAGAPENFGAAPLWTYSAAISAANGITTTGGAISLNLNATNAVGNPLDLPPGRYWMTVTPNVNGTGAQTAAEPLWAWYISDAPQVGSVPKLYAPWNDPLAFQTATGANVLAGFVQGTVSCALPTWVSLTTTSGSLGAGASQAVPVVFNAAGLSAGVYSGALCVTSNATNTPVVSVPLTFTVPNGGAMAPTLSKAFSPGSVAANVDSTLTITLSNSNSTAATLTSALTDSFPTGLVVAPTPAESTTCPAGVVTATAGAGSVSLALGAQIPAGSGCAVGDGGCTAGTCTVSVNVRAATASSYPNTIAAGGLVTNKGNNAAAASATLTVTAAPITYTVTPSVSGGNGAIAPSVPQTVNSGATSTFTLTPNSGFVIGPVTGTCGGTLSGSSYTTAAVIADCTVIASFTPPPACTTSQPIEVKATGGTMGPTGYVTLKAAFDAINSGTHTGVLDVAVCGDTTETASAVLNADAVGSASYSAASIKPANGGARTISGDIAGPLVDLNGADNVTIDGLNTGGNALTIANASISATAGTSTIRFIGGATSNTVTNATLLGSSTTTLATVGGGTVYFADDVVALSGNDNNTISNSNIGPAGTNLPNKAIFALGAVANANSGVVINNNNIYDFFNPAASVSGIYVGNGNDAWTMSGNRIYQTAARTFTTTLLRYAGITMSQGTTPRGSFTITGNVIGFGAANGTGTTTIGGLGNEFRGIDAPNVDTTVATSIQGNTISGINQTTTRTSTTSSSSAFAGMQLGNVNGFFDIGGVAGNTIGSLDGSSTIVINSTPTGSTAAAIGIYDFSFTNSIISNNNIGAITIQGAGTTLGFRGILVTGTGTQIVTMANNTIGGAGTTGAILDSQSGANAVYGVQSTAGNVVLTGNTVSNMTGNGNGASINVGGLLITATGTVGSTIARNTVHSLTDISAGANAGAVYAIDLTLATAPNLVERNRIHSLSATSTATYQIYGLITRGTSASTTTYKNNMVRLGFDAAGNAVTSPFLIIGIRDSLGTGVTNQYYNNSVYVGGTGVVGGTIGNVGSYAFNSDVVTTARNFQDNIFWNARSNAAAAAFHVAARYGGTTVNPTGLTANYNDIYATGTDGFVGLFNGFVYPDLTSFKAATGQDANSFSGDPQFIAPTGDAATGNLHIHPTNPTPVEASGTPIASVTDDYDGELRSGLTPTDVGADAGNFVALVVTTYQVTPSVGTGSGTIAPAVAQTVNSGATTSFTLTPASGFAIGTTTGTCGGSLSGSVYTTNAVSGDCTVVANFTQITYQVTPSVGTGSGSISPSTPQTVNSGATQAFTLTPASGFAIGTTTGTCGGSLSGSVYTTNAISGDCTVVANFTQITYQVTPSVGTGSGTIAPAVAQTVNSGATTSFTLTPASGFAIGSTTGTCGGSLSGSVYTTNAISGDCTVVANFTQITYQVTPSVGTGSGTIAPAVAQTVNSGATTSFTLTPASGFAIGSTTGTCGGSLSGSVYTTNAVSGDCTVVANFTQITYQVTPSVSGGNGSVSPATAQTVNSGATSTFTLTPNSGYASGPVSGTCGGALTGNSYTTNAVSADCTVIASFTELLCTTSQPIEVKATGGTLGPSGYATLKAAFDAINGGTHTGVLDVAVCGDTTETASAVLNADGVGSASYSAASIKPVNGAARTITGSLTAPLVDFNGADNVTIDGVNSGGNALTISNTNTGTTSTTSTIRFIGGATGNTVTNSSLLGSMTMAAGTNGGIVFFSTDGLTANGNDNNTISNNNIGPAGANLPTKAIHGNGSTTTTVIANSGNIINNNNIYDVFSPTASVIVVNLLTGNDGWTVSNNRIYQTAARTFTTTALKYTAIGMSNAAGAHTFTGNRIGFGAADGTGTTTISGSTNVFRGIEVINASSTVATSIQGNTISGINQSTASVGTGTTTQFIAMMLGTTAGRFDVGNVTGNNIGSLDGSSTVVINASAGTGAVTGIYDFSVSANTFANNNIGSVTIQGTGTTVGFRGILVNTGSGVTATVTGNTIANVTNTQVGSYSLYGIQTSLPSAIVTDNVIRNFTGNANGGVVVMAGINVSAGSATSASTVARNTVHSLRNTVVGGASGAIYALDFTFPAQANIVERNLVHSISVDTTFVGYQVNGIIVRGGTTAATGSNSTVGVRNNMIRLGFDATGAPITAPLGFTGIRDTAGSSVANNYYHNSVYIGGSGVTGGVALNVGTTAFSSDVLTTTRNFQNNIFWNARSNVTTGAALHIAMRVGGTTVNPAGLTSNYNDLYATGNDGVVGVYNGIIDPTLADWQTATGQDANSFSANPQFISPNGSAATGNLHINPAISTPVEATGTPIASVTDDYDGEVRSGLTPTDVGADAGNFIP